jgi:hypothetical protein
VTDRQPDRGNRAPMLLTVLILGVFLLAIVGLVLASVAGR